MQAKLREIISQLESCGYECIAGPLENNVAFQELKELAETDSQEVSSQMIIEGVELKALVRHYDERGYFQEIIRETDPFFERFGQWSVSLMWGGVTKAFHLHQIQYDYWLVPSGVIKAVLHDLREDSPTKGLTNEFMMGDGYDPFVLKIPPGVAHGLKVIQGPAHLFYVTSRVYDPKDEGRIPHDDKTIGYDWLKGPEIK